MSDPFSVTVFCRHNLALHAPYWKTNHGSAPAIGCVCIVGVPLRAGESVVARVVNPPSGTRLTRRGAVEKCGSADVECVGLAEDVALYVALAG